MLALALAGCSERFEWREFRSRDGFVITLPGRWQTVEREIDFGGQAITMSMTSTGRGASVFAAGVAKLPPTATVTADDRQKAAAFFADALVRNVGAGASVRTPIALPRSADRAQTPGFGLSVTATGRAGRENRPVELAARIVIVDDRAIQVVALTAPGEVPPEVVETFFTSFRLVP